MCLPHSMWHPQQTAGPVSDLSLHCTLLQFGTLCKTRQARAYENTDREMIRLLEKDLARKK